MDQAELLGYLRLTDVRVIAWSDGAEVVEANAHDTNPYYSVVVAPDAVKGREGGERHLHPQVRSELAASTGATAA